MVDNFGIKYTNKSDVDHLINAVYMQQLPIFSIMPPATPMLK